MLSKKVDYRSLQIKINAEKLLHWKKIYAFMYPNHFNWYFVNKFLARFVASGDGKNWQKKAQLQGYRHSNIFTRLKPVNNVTQF